MMRICGSVYGIHVLTDDAMGTSAPGCTCTCTCTIDERLEKT
jgi:hypothetical protein